MKRPHVKNGNGCNVIFRSVILESLLICVFCCHSEDLQSLSGVKDQSKHNIFVPLCEPVTACATHPLNGTIIAGTKVCAYSPSSQSCNAFILYLSCTASSLHNSYQQLFRFCLLQPLRSDSIGIGCVLCQRLTTLPIKKL